MSHFTTITTQIKDIEVLRKACEEMGLTLTQGITARGYGVNRRPGEHVIVLKGPYDIAVNRQPDGSYGLTTDWWDGHVEKEVGPSYGRLIQLYGVWKTAIEATRKGYMVTRETLKNGSIKVYLSGGPLR